MLVKWAIEGRRKTANATPSVNTPDRHGSLTMSAPSSANKVSPRDRSRITGHADRPETTASALTSQLDRLHYQNDAAFAKTSENEADRALRRIQAEERDTKLRDDKLLSLTGPELHRHGTAQGRESESTMPLTEENMERFAHAQDGDEATPAHKSDQDRTLPMTRKAGRRAGQTNLHLDRHSQSLVCAKASKRSQAAVPYRNDRISY